MPVALDTLPTFDHPLGFKVRECGPNVLMVYLDARSAKDWEQWFLLSSDRHHDNAHADWRLEKKHLEEAVAKRAGVLDIGDLFCAMQGKWDKRSDLTQCRPEHQTNSYLDKLVSTGAEFYAPYAGNLMLIGRGNHETGIEKRHQTDLTERLVAKLQERNPSLRAGGYGGWVLFRFKINKTQQTTVRYKYYHGSGGGGPVTRGVIQTNRMAVYLPDADIVHTGHTHDEWVVPIARERISEAGVLYKDRQTHVRTAGYKDEYADGFGGWHVERGAAPKPLSAAWLRFYYDCREKTVLYEIREAR